MYQAGISWLPRTTEVILWNELPLVDFSFGVVRVEIAVVVDLLGLGFGRGRVEGGILLVRVVLDGDGRVGVRSNWSYGRR